MRNIIVQSILARKVALISYSLGSVLFVFLFIVIYPSIQDQADEFNKLLEAYPPEFVTAFNIENLDFASLESFLASEYASFMWPLLAIFLAVSFAGNGITKEIERGTMELLLAKPVSRLKIYFGRLSGAAISVIIFTAISFLCTIPLAELFDIEYVAKNHIAVSVMGGLLALAVLSTAQMIATFFSERSRVYMFTGVLLLGMYIAKIITNFEEKLDEIKYLSFFHYFSGTETLVDATYNKTAIAVFVGTIIVTTIIGAITFQKRDIAV